MIRSSIHGFDEVLCAIQGHAAACIINAAKGAALFNPINTAICFAGVCAVEKLVYMVSKRVMPGHSGSLGPIPIGSKNIVSHGLAIYTTMEIMKLAGLILSVPQVVTIIGLTCAATLAVGGLQFLMFEKNTRQRETPELQEMLTQFADLANRFA